MNKVFLFLLLIREVVLVAFNEFYKTDSSTAVRLTSSSDSEYVAVNSPWLLYDASATKFFVSRRGFVTLGESYTGFAPVKLPWNGPAVISVYWTNSTPNDQHLIFYNSTNPTMVAKFADDVGTVFPDLRNNINFSEIFISTWLSNKTFSFQCVLGLVNNYSFAVFLYESNQASGFDTSETGIRESSSAVVGFHDGHDNFWVTPADEVTLRDSTGNVPSSVGKYVLGLRKSACSASKWSTNIYCSIDYFCVLNNYSRRENCETCEVRHSRFSWTLLECFPSSEWSLVRVLGVAIGGGCGLVLLFIIAVAIVQSYHNCRSYSVKIAQERFCAGPTASGSDSDRADISSVQNDLNSLSSSSSAALEPETNKLSETLSLTKDSTVSPVDKTTTATTDGVTTVETKRYRLSLDDVVRKKERQFRLRLSHRKVQSANLPVRDTTTYETSRNLAHYCAEMQPVVNRVSEKADTAKRLEDRQNISDNVEEDLPLVWIVGKKAIKIGMHELTFEFPDDCLDHETYVVISLKYQPSPFNDGSFCYVYAVAPHTLKFKKPVVLRFNSKEKAEEASLWRKKFTEGEWLLLGKFGIENYVSVWNFCHLCVKQKEKSKELGPGYSYYNLLVVAMRKKTSIIIEVKILADGCIDTLETERKRWINEIGAEYCFTQNSELLLYKEGTITVTFSAPEKSSPWEIQDDLIQTKDVASLLKTLGSVRLLAAYHVVPKPEKTIDNVLSNSHPGILSVSFKGSDVCSVPILPDSVKLPLYFAEHLHALSASAELINPRIKFLFLSLGRDQIINKESASAAAQNTFPDYDDQIEFGGETWELILAVSSVAARSSNDKQKSFSSALLCTMEERGKEDWVDVLYNWVRKRKERPPKVKHLLHLAKYAEIEEKLIKDEFLRLCESFD